MICHWKKYAFTILSLTLLLLMACRKDFEDQIIDKEDPPST